MTIWRWLLLSPICQPSFGTTKHLIQLNIALIWDLIKKPTLSIKFGVIYYRYPKKILKTLQPVMTLNFTLILTWLCRHTSNEVVVIRYDETANYLYTWSYLSFHCYTLCRYFQQCTSHILTWDLYSLKNKTFIDLIKLPSFAQCNCLYFVQRQLFQSFTLLFKIFLEIFVGCSHCFMALMIIMLEIQQCLLL